MRKILISCLCIMSFYAASAQNDAMYSQYMFNMFTINPAYAGTRNAPSLSSMYRRQWVGVPGAPQTMLATYDMPMMNNKLGFGAQLVNDKLGVENINTVNMAISSRVQVSDRAILSVGLNAGLQNYQANLQDANTFVPNDPAFYQNLSGTVPVVGAGIFYNTDNFYLGVSSPNIIKSKLSVSQVANQGAYTINDLRFFLTCGYVFSVSDDVKLKPSVLIKSVSGAPIQADLNTNVWIKDIVGIGASYRTGESIVGMAEFQLTPQLRFGYAYDKMINTLGAYSQGTHEFLIRYEFGSFRQGNIASPRYF